MCETSGFLTNMLACVVRVTYWPAFKAGCCCSVGILCRKPCREHWIPAPLSLFLARTPTFSPLQKGCPENPRYWVSHLCTVRHSQSQAYRVNGGASRWTDAVLLHLSLNLVSVQGILPTSKARHHSVYLLSCFSFFRAHLVSLF